MKLGARERERKVVRDALADELVKCLNVAFGAVCCYYLTTGEDPYITSWWHVAWAVGAYTFVGLAGTWFGIWIGRRRYPLK